MNFEGIDRRNIYALYNHYLDIYAFAPRGSKQEQIARDCCRLIYKEAGGLL